VEDAIWGLTGTIVGAIASIATTWMSAKNSIAVQKQNADDARAELSRAFQRETLLELQEAIHDALRLISTAYIEDSKHHQSTGNWVESRLSEEVNEGIRLANRKVAILAERVANDTLRSEIKTLMNMANKSLYARRKVEAEESLHCTSSKATEVLESLGTILRLHY
jgi:hypothetical protein